MRLAPKLIAEWPKLAWVARWAPAPQVAPGDSLPASAKTVARPAGPAGGRGTDVIELYHGPCVEIGDGWAAEAVWAGEFADGDFDRTDLVFGTGLRCRQDHVTFVSSGTVLDRLWYARSGEALAVSNSLPALLATTGLALREDYPSYTEDMRSICRGLKAYTRRFPADGGDLFTAYFNNLVFDGADLRETEKPDTAPPLETFQDYRDFLVRTAERLGANRRDPARRAEAVPLASISSGYDSPAAAVIARHAGCRRAVTIRRSTSLWRGSDSGEGIARQLGLACEVYPRLAARFPQEEAVWAVTGRPGILNWALFDYPEPLCLFFSASHGDKMWDRAGGALADPFVMPSVAELGLGELRLLRGVFQCVVPYWGMRHVEAVRRISLRPEMEPWTLHTRYDRPIARRLLEEAGVARGTFAARKKNTSLESPFLWPYSPESRARLRAYLAARGLRAPPAWWTGAARRLARLDNLIHLNITSRLGFDLGLRRRLGSPSSNTLFLWATAELRGLYERGLQSAGVAAAGP